MMIWLRESGALKSSLTFSKGSYALPFGSVSGVSYIAAFISWGMRFAYQQVHPSLGARVITTERKGQLDPTTHVDSSFSMTRYPNCLANTTIPQNVVTSRSVT